MSRHEEQARGGLLIPTSPTEAFRVTVFLDEIKPSVEVPWAYLAIVSLPTERVDEELCAIQKLRDDIGYQRELKFSGIRKRGTKSRLAQALVKRAVDGIGVWHFGVVGIDMTRLSREAFGDSPGDQVANAHRRFLRSTLLYHLKCCYAVRPLIVDRVFHDNEGRLEADPWFRWHGIGIITNELSDIQFPHPRIEFVDSEHEAEPRFPHLSHFIQVADLIVGAARYACDTPRHKFSPGAEDVAVELLPLLARMNDPMKRWDTMCPYGSANRCHLGFFPSRSLSLEVLADPYVRARSTFYVGREIRLEAKVRRQYALPLQIPDPEEPS